MAADAAVHEHIGVPDWVMLGFTLKPEEISQIAETVMAQSGTLPSRWVAAQAKIAAECSDFLAELRRGMATSGGSSAGAKALKLFFKIMRLKLGQARGNIRVTKGRLLLEFSYFSQGDTGARRWRLFLAGFNKKIPAEKSTVGAVVTARPPGYDHPVR
eukprot:COSAG01_NODE_2180_length_8215_cov_3.853006_3_plen_158_part_00